MYPLYPLFFFLFQSPSLRGSGRFVDLFCDGGASRRRFQSPSLRGSGRFLKAPSRRAAGGQVSIPFIAGQWSLLVFHERRGKCSRRVSIPFIAGQWSLRKSPVRFCSRCFCLNPLHCGAVVASDGFVKSWGIYVLCLNPLHCGAVVASFVIANFAGRIPVCLNPLHCGAVVAST